MSWLIYRIDNLPPYVDMLIAVLLIAYGATELLHRRSSR